MVMIVGLRVWSGSSGSFIRSFTQRVNLRVAFA